MAAIDKIYISYDNWFIVKEKLETLKDDFKEFTGYKLNLYQTPISREHKDYPIVNLDMTGDYFMLLHFYDNEEVMRELHKMYKFDATDIVDIKKEMYFDLKSKLKEDLGEKMIEFEREKQEILLQYNNVENSSDKFKLFEK